MIEKMKKLTFLVTESEYESFIASLRELGVVHIQQLQKGATSQELQDGMELEQRYKSALQALDIYAKTYKEMAIPQSVQESSSPCPNDKKYEIKQGTNRHPQIQRVMTPANNSKIKTCIGMNQYCLYRNVFLPEDIISCITIKNKRLFLQ